MDPCSIYIHIPYCHQKCPYCDFNTYAVSIIPEDEYVEALLSELDFRAALPEWSDRQVTSIYFGGGTPSLLSEHAIYKIIHAISLRFRLIENIEITIEANPGPLTAEKTSDLVEAGVNRLSIGAQSFSPKTLKTLGRNHSPEQIEAAVEGSRAAGMNNISLDLMYGVPGQSFKGFVHDMEEMVAMNPNHISVYGLTIEKGTPFYTAIKKQTMHLPRESYIIKMMNELFRYLPSSGFERYEISNFSPPGFEARHNMAYWNGSDYLGLGAGAHSYSHYLKKDENSFGTRWANFASPKKYMKDAVAKGNAASWSENLDLQNAMFEFFFLGLRKISGVSEEDFKERFGFGVETIYGPLLDALISGQLITREDNNIALSDRGLMLADSVIENFSNPELRTPVNELDLAPQAVGE